MGVVPVSKRHYTSEERKSENVQKKKKIVCMSQSYGMQCSRYWKSRKIEFFRFTFIHATFGGSDISYNVTIFC